MKKIIKDLESKIQSLDMKITNEDLGVIIASLNDYLESFVVVESNVKKIVETNSEDEIQTCLIDIQMELCSHIADHIEDIRKPLGNIINELE